ncbi:hypothetical protein [uncultured Vibrio sp.]|uniref:hypothetical protein n=1 Tax=uncultured Vibrio sp. TaxID=114054 RepID=UPI00261906A8|nr:hypothetical protein [uncultured Vibrio sp.]
MFDTLEKKIINGFLVGSIAFVALCVVVNFSIGVVKAQTNNCYHPSGVSLANIPIPTDGRTPVTSHKALHLQNKATQWYCGY